MKTRRTRRIFIGALYTIYRYLARGMWASPGQSPGRSGKVSSFPRRQEPRQGRTEIPAFAGMTKAAETNSRDGPGCVSRAITAKVWESLVVPAQAGTSPGSNRDSCLRRNDESGRDKLTRWPWVCLQGNRREGLGKSRRSREGRNLARVEPRFLPSQE